jgi:hypothetical protein
VAASTTRRLAFWSVRTYALLLYLYPCAFRTGFGASMTQVFEDLARDASRNSGLTGLAALWVVTLVDLLVSLAQLYAQEGRRAMFKVVVAAGALYIAALALTAGYGAIKFGDFYDPPAFTMFNTSAPTNEDALIAAYEQALTGEFGRYKAYTFVTGLILAVMLGLASSLVGLWRRSLLHGAGAFVAGVVVTVAAFELLPSIWFPFDRYAVGFAWVVSGFPLAAGVWVVVTLIGRFSRTSLRTA